MNKYWGKDSYRDGEVIIPPQSILDGTAPAKVFIEYVNSVDITKIPMRYYVPILHLLSGMMDALPEDVRKKLYGEAGKD